MSKSKARRTAERFFFDNAGWSHDPETETPTQGRWRGARELADAERKARESEWTAEWVADEPADTLEDLGHATQRSGDGWCEPDCGRNHWVLACVLKDRRGEVLASLGAIIDPNCDYSRVVEAELALEALAAIQKTLEEAI